MENKKYELTDETIKLDGKTLHRIRALTDFGNVKAGETGGYIQSEKNLSQKGACWVYDEAKVYDYAYVCDNAKVREKAVVKDDATVEKNADVSGEACVYDNAFITDEARVFGHANVFDGAWVDKNEVHGGNEDVVGYWHIVEEDDGSLKTVQWGRK